MISPRLLTTLFSLFCLWISAQKIQKGSLPAAITEAFASQFPKAADIDWKKKDTLFEVEFELGTPKKDHTAIYNKEAKIVYHQEDLVVDDLPAPVLKSVRSSYPGYEIEEVQKTEIRGVDSYQVAIEKEGEDVKLILDSKGTILEKKVN